jgi:tyrocidine synthetase-3
MSHEACVQSAPEPGPVTDFQAALWASYRLDRENLSHNAPLLVHWNCEIDVDRFERAFSEVVRTTDSLRIVFEQTAGEVRQTALDHVGYHLLRHDFSTHADPRYAAIAWLTEIVAQPHSLTTTPLRTAIARLGDQSWIWLLDQHHILTDYSSKCLILSRLDHFYGSRPQDAAPASRYPSFVKLVPRICEDDGRASPGTDGETPDIFGERIITTADKPDADMLLHQFCLKVPDSKSLKARKEIFDHLGAALVALVGTISSRSQFQVGLVINRRKRLQAADCCGPILRTDSLSISFPENCTNAEIAQEWRRSIKEMKRNPDSPAGQRHHNRVIFNFTLDPLPDFDGCRTIEISHETPVQGTSDGIRLTARPGSEPGTIRLILSLSPQMARATGGAKTVAQHFLTIYDFIVGDPSAKISEVDFLGGQSAEQERYQAEAAFRVNPEMPPTILDAFLRAKANHPDATAVSEGDRHLTYRDLDDLSRKLAAALRKRSVKPGDVVIVALPRTIEWVVTALAVFRMGAIFCPMDATASQERVLAIVAQTHAALRIACSTEWAPEVSVTVQELMTHDSGDTPDQIPTGEDCAYLIFTSGSTGTPKGVIVRHHPLVRFLEWYKNNVKLDASSVFGLTSAPFFDTTLCAFAMFLVGGEIRVYPEEAGRLAVISGVIEDRSTFLICTPSIATAMLQFPNLQRPTRLRTFSVAGEVFSSMLYSRLRAFLGPDIRILNDYGPTETTVGVSAQEFVGDHSGSLVGRPFILPVGKAMPNSYFRIMNSAMRPLPPGFIGEIFIGGQQLAEGYFERPNETQKAFMQSPCNADLRLYKTGDVGRLTPDGTLVLLGRADNQLKFNGIRIEPFQVELALTKHPHVADAAVALRGDPASLCAWYVSDREVPHAELRQIAMKSIQPGMFPTKLMRVEQIPRSAGGKREYGSLPSHDFSPTMPTLHDSSASGEPDSGEIDVITETVIAIWRDVLQRKVVWDLDIGFDDLGGDSLAAMRMIFQVEHVFGIELDQISFFDINSVRTLVAKIKSIKAASHKRGQREARMEGASEGDATVQRFLSEVGRVLDMWPGEQVDERGLIRVLNKTGSKPPLVWCFNDSSEPESLAASLGTDQPLYILRSAQGLMDLESKEWYEAQIAAIYARAIFTVIRPGPVAVGGNCQGSRIALMLANTLLQLKVDVVSTLVVEPAFLIPYLRRVLLMPGSGYSKINSVFKYANPQFGWNRYFRDYRVAMIRGGHGEYFQPENVGSLSEIIEGELDAAFCLPRLRLATIEKLVDVKVVVMTGEWRAGTAGLVEVSLVAGTGSSLVMNEETGITVSFRWESETPLHELPRPSSGFPSQRLIGEGESAVERFSVQSPQAKGRFTLVVQLCEEGVGYFGEPARVDIDLC